MAVYTYGRVPFCHFLAFKSIADSVWEQLGQVPEGQGLVGFSGAFSPGSWGSTIAETLTIWSESTALGDFYRSDTHKNAAGSWKENPGERVWVSKVWIRGSVLQPGVSKELYARLKQGEFRIATDVNKLSLQKAD